MCGIAGLVDGELLMRHAAEPGHAVNLDGAVDWEKTEALLAEKLP